MKTIKLLKGPILVDATHFGIGDIVTVPDDRAYSMIDSGIAEKSDGKPKNEFNDQADNITPPLPAELVVKPLETDFKVIKSEPKVEPKKVIPVVAPVSPVSPVVVPVPPVTVVEHKAE